jgi:hypothetical protein
VSNEIELFRWWLPPNSWRRQEYLSSYHMTREQAALAGALRADLASRMVVRPVADTGRLGAAPAIGHSAA